MNSTKPLKNNIDFILGIKFLFKKLETLKNVFYEINPVNNIRVKFKMLYECKCKKSLI